MNEIRQLTDNIHLLCFDFSETMRSHLYLIHDQDEAVLIDAHIGSMAQDVMDTIEQITPLSNLKVVILTHGHMDHTGACPALVEKTNAEVAIHIADAQYIQEPWTQFQTLFQDLGTTKEAYDGFLQLVGGKGVTVTRPLQDGDRIQVGSLSLQIIHTPGHSPGSVCVYEPISQTIFTGDALIPSEWYHTHIAVFQDAVNYIQSLKKLSGLEIKTLCAGHDHIRVGDQVQKEFEIHFKRYYDIEETLLTVLQSDGLSLYEIFHEVAERLLVPGDYVPGIGETISLRAFLNKLVFEGKVQQVNGSKWRC